MTIKYIFYYLLNYFYLYCCFVNKKEKKEDKVTVLLNIHLLSNKLLYVDKYKVMFTKVFIFLYY